MKIKCPICGIEYEYVSGSNHLLESHFPKDIADSLHEFVFKIHEKIEQIEKLNEYRQKEWNETDFTNDQIIKELKSLLEDKE